MISRLATTLKGMSALPVTGCLYTLPSGSYATLLVTGGPPAPRFRKSIDALQTTYVSQYAIVLLFTGWLLLGPPTN